MDGPWAASTKTQILRLLVKSNKCDSPTDEIQESVLLKISLDDSPAVWPQMWFIIHKYIPFSFYYDYKGNYSRQKLIKAFTD